MRGRSDSGGILYGDREGLEKKLPIVVEYLSLFTREQVNDVLSKLFTSESELDTKLIFSKFNLDEHLKDLLYEAVESQEVKTMDGHLLIGQYYADEGEMSKATEALKIARVMGRTERKHNPASNEIKLLAKKIGDESLAKDEIGIEYYQRAGFVDFSTVDEGVVYERAVNEPLMFYKVTADEEDAEKAGIKTFVVKISKVVGEEGKYRVEIITKQGGGSSHRRREISSRIYLRDLFGSKEFLGLDVDRLEGERFKLTVRRE
jgi:hypothetical protein